MIEQAAFQQKADSANERKKAYIAPPPHAIT